MAQGLLQIDDVNWEQVRRAIERLPQEVKGKAMRRAMTRMAQMARPKIVARSAEHTKLPKEVVAKLTTAHFNAGGNTSQVTVESGWIPLRRLGAVQNASGVFVNLRGSYRHAFIAAFKSGHVGVMRRIPGTKMSSNEKKEQIRELWGPNPAHAITNNPDVYLDVLAELIQERLYPRFVHELDFIISKAGR
jgi:hypothetical protein